MIEPLILLLAIWLPLLKSAGITGVITAVRGFFPLHSSLKFLLEESGGQSYINMSPGEELIQGTHPLGIEAGVKPGLLKGTKPVFIIEVLVPGIKS